MGLLELSLCVHFEEGSFSDGTVAEHNNVDLVVGSHLCLVYYNKFKLTSDYKHTLIHKRTAKKMLSLLQKD